MHFYYSLILHAVYYGSVAQLLRICDIYAFDYRAFYTAINNYGIKWLIL
jgi:hypothetical protein